MNTPSDVILQTTNLGKRYGHRWAVKGVHLTVHRGEVFGFLGPNGAGKSTTIRMLLSLVKPTAGGVDLFGRALTSSRREMLGRVGGLVERPDFYLYLPARRNLEIVASLMGGVSPGSIDEVLEIVGLGSRSRDKVKTYSHGMKQRLGLAQALLGSPEFIILDEPTSGLDPQGIKEVRELIKQLSVERGITIFLSSHLLSEIEQTATSMAIINAGELVVQGRVQELLHEEDSVVKIVAEPLEAARTIVGSFAFVRTVVVNGRTIEARMSPEHVNAVNAALVQGGVAVHALIPRRSLEEYFLAITEGASDVNPPVNRKH